MLINKNKPGKLNGLLVIQFDELVEINTVAIAIQTDNGSEFNKYFMSYLEQQQIIHYWNYPGRPYRQGHIEKFNRTIQEEFVD